MKARKIRQIKIRKTETIKGVTADSLLTTKILDDTTPVTASPKVSPDTIANPHDLMAKASGTNSYETASALSLYLREISETPLLTVEEEIDLAAQIKAGNEDARQRMIKANLRLVVKIARDYEGFGLSLLDLVNEGNIGLMKAVDRFDPAKGGKMSTYSAWWIKQSIKRALANQAKTIRLPVHMVGKISRMKRAAHRLQEIIGREPTVEELAQELDLSTKRVAMMRNASTRPASLEAGIGEDGDACFGDIIADENASTPYQELESKTSLDLLSRVIHKLDERESRIISHRFGLNDAEVKTLEEIGKDFGVTRERIRQLQNSALAKLRDLMEDSSAIQFMA